MTTQLQTGQLQAGKLQAGRNRVCCVLVLTVEGISSDWILGTASVAQETAISELDLNAACFERFFLQRVNDRDFASTLGDLNHWNWFLRNLSSLGCSVRLFKSSQSESCAWPIPSDQQEEPGPLLRTLEATGMTVGHPDAVDSANLEKLQSDVCWIHLPELLDDNEATGRVIKQLRRLRQVLEISGSHPCSLVILPLRGSSFAPAAPLESGFPEALHHVPLWIDAGQRHVFRVQQLSGSDDILPTILSLVRLSRTSAIYTAETMANGEHGPSSGIDLSEWLQSPGKTVHREITIEFAGAEAVISEDSLTVKTQDNHGDLTSTSYRRPEDPWSVNSVVEH